ncbi:3-hydroxyacyl-CoA dehydrogenase [Salipaludibacillus keqinensis]|uniref:3-hydroxyacyl-CoA dehydrogenase n=1 Tax=Salipaludibacillus keqinensis TaxID=2045207 RepID=A0A323THI1_9BACI|nr:thioesterase family protein [Salipaludibacillus keqinensis]PYZ93384.1 3-hydroxyacyl-CoA dehydrogenase [Salipaludibacillus keqinensis]
MEIPTFQYRCLEQWVDYNGHMNDAAYAQVFSLALDSWIEVIGLDEKTRAKHQYTMFTLETHLCYLQEVKEGETLHITLQLLDSDEKRLHILLEMKNNDGTLVATSEQMLMGIDTSLNKPGPFPIHVSDYIARLKEQHSRLEIPKQVGRRIGIKRK